MASGAHVAAGAAAGAVLSTRIAVVVSTRNRPDDVVGCVRTILANTSPSFELVVVDQSDRPVSPPPEAEFAGDSRLRWIRTTTRGLSASRNVAIAATSAPVIAFTDDDCRVPQDWVASVESAFAKDDELALLFGAVILRPEDRVKGYAAEFEPHAVREFKSTLPPADAAWGVGANMSVRRSTFDKVGTFDVMLGAGAPLFAAEEIDLTIRALGAGLKVVHTPAIAVIHLGVREGAAASHLMRGYGVGLGATLGKHMRLGTRGAATLLTGWLGLQLRRSVLNVMRGHRNPGFGLAAAVARGALRAFRMPLDKAHGMFGHSG